MRTSRKKLLEELRALDDAIDQLYWTFTRTARGKPPIVVRPDLYARRAEVERLLGLRRKKKNPSEDAARWAVIETEGGELGSPGAWNAKTFPLFREPVTNAALQAMDAIGGARFTPRTLAEEIGKVQGERRALAPATIRGRIRHAIAELVRAGYAIATDYKPERVGFRRGEKVFEPTKLGLEAALASRMVPEVARGEALVPEAIEAMAEHHAGRRERQVIRRAPEYAGEYVAPEGGAEVFLPWREGGLGDPFGKPVKPKIAFRKRHEGGHVVIEAWDESPYLQGSTVQVGELWLRLGRGDDRTFGDIPTGYAFAAVSWVWVHPEWAGSGEVMLRLHDYAAREAAMRGLPLASPVDRGPEQDAFWLDQVQKRQATVQAYSAPGFAASRYFLDYPPPVRLNPDVTQRELLRKVIGGDANAAQRYVTELRRTGKLDQVLELDTATRSALYKGLVEIGGSFPEHLQALWRLGDEAASVYGQPTPYYVTVHVLFERHLADLGAMFDVIAGLAVVEAIFYGPANDNKTSRVLNKNVPRIFAVARAWLEDGDNPHGPRKRKMRGEAQRTADRVRREHAATGLGVAEQAVVWFFRTEPLPNRLSQYMTHMIADLEDLVFYADLNPDAQGPHGVRARALSEIMWCAENLVVERLVLDGQARGYDTGIVGDRIILAVLRRALTPWIVSAAPSTWKLPEVKHAR